MMISRCLPFKLMLAGFCAAGLNAAADPPLVMPLPEAGFFVRTEAAPGTLEDGMVLWGQGWIEAGKEPGTEYFGRVPARHYRWTRGGFRLVSRSNVWAVLTLHAPPAAPRDGLVFHGALALGDVQAEGAVIANGHFHAAAGGLPDGWSWYPDAAAAGAGRQVFEDGRAGMLLPSGTGVRQRIFLAAGRTVTVRFSVRAVPDGDFDDLPRLPPGGTPAHAAVRHYARGVNLGNYLEAPPGEDWGARYDAADFDAIRAEGFDHVRIPCAWHHHSGPAPEYAIAGEFFERVDAMVRAATRRDLAVIVNWHHFDDFTADPAAYMLQFERGWSQIAGRYAGFPGKIAFELLNEPHAAADTPTMNRVYARIIPLIRAQAPDNLLMVGPGRWNHAAELDQLRLPATESNLVVTVHDYDPFLFTHQGASWTQPLTAATNIGFPGPPSLPLSPPPPALEAAGWVEQWFRAYNRLPAEWNPAGVSAIGINLRNAAAWSRHYGRPVHVGEWGCIVLADEDARLRYMRAKRRLLEELELPWTVWDWKALFRYWDADRQAPVAGMREALFD